ncbi:transglycosylase SLT domain-containing protein [Photobacterium sp. 1_MG-2023]|uniref:transglycosylase SLT domain-containing protein n=1 Tax=Photobacterium sp. 1_MG-2023 TaxID=3062646 RepID=UPI0026E2BCD9|nr:transglycosylase SLT domain-containing protein [Photobacterium sp. 1_MG-2023]MDO6705367.1 transglycosylase SLT domain-containing protein [Photobacterium sp. 1_MG-2023]
MKYAIPLFLFSFQILTGCSSLSVSETKESNAKTALTLTPNTIRLCTIGHHELAGRYLATGLPGNYQRPTLPELSLMKEASLWERLSRESMMAIPDEPRIRYYRHWYHSRPLHISTVSERAKPFLFYIYEHVQSRGLPAELALLPFIESAFDPDAYSHQGAAGLWQITKATGKAFGLTIVPGYDGRLDIAASTQAALDLLEYLYARFDGNWLHAIAAYNTGESRVRKAIKRNKSQGKPTDFWSLDLPKETEHYVPKLLALSLLLKNYQPWQSTLTFIPDHAVLAPVMIDQQIPLKQIADDAGLSREFLNRLNPAYRAGLTLKNTDNILLLPQKQLAHFYQQNKLHYTKHQFRIHFIRPGDTLLKIANGNDISINTIQQVNQIANSKIQVGQHLFVPVPESVQP